jgi:hypothetical protein
LDGLELEEQANALLAKKVSPVGDCDEAVTHVFIGDPDACAYAASAVAAASDGALAGPSCGDSGEDAVLLRCADFKTPPQRIGRFAAAAHKDSRRNPQGALIVKELLLTAEKDRNKWGQLFRESFGANCDKKGEARKAGKEDTRLVNATVTLDGEPLLPGVKGHALLARLKKDPRPTPDDCSREELTHVLIGDQDACIYEADTLAADSNGSVFGPACGRSGRDVEVILCTKAGVAGQSQGKFDAACHKDSERDIEGTLIVEELLLTSKKPSEWSGLFRESYLANCLDND